MAQQELKQRRGAEKSQLHVQEALEKGQQYISLLHQQLNLYNVKEK